MTLEDRLGELLREDAAGYRPAEDGLARIEARLRGRRRGRSARRVLVSVAAVAAAVAIVVPLATDRGNPHGQVVEVVPPSSPSTAPTAAPVGPSNQLVIVDGTHVIVHSATTGVVVRTLALAPPLPGTPGGPASIDPTGRTVYVAVPVDVACTSQEIVAVDLRSGRDRVVALSAIDPTISPDGSRLAYASLSAPSCSISQITVKDLASGARRTWQVSQPSTGDQPTEEVQSLRWAPDGRRLVIGSMSGPVSGIQILDTTEAAGSSNPVTVGPSASGSGGPAGRYRDPTLRPDGSMVAVAPLCWGASSCPPSPIDGDAVVTVDRVSGDVASTIVASGTDPQVQLSDLVVDPSGERLAVEGFGALSGQTDLYEITGGRLHLVANNVTAAGWLPRLRQPQPTRSTPTTSKSSASRGKARGTLAGTLVISGGPAPGTPRPVPGTVHIRGAGGDFTVTVRSDGAFSRSVPPGAYRVTGTSPDIQQGGETCESGGPAEVASGRTTDVHVACDVP